MSYENEYAIGTQVLHSLNYHIGSHGDLSAHFDSMVNADLPLYTAKFYSPTPSEQAAVFKYKRVEIGYDESLREIAEAMQGLPMEAYIPMSMETSDTGSSSPAVKRIEPSKVEIVDEITEAQNLVKGREIVIKDIEEIVLRRYREIRLKEKDI